MFFSKPKSFLGIDFGAGGVKLVELKQEKNRPVLFTYALALEAQDIHRILNVGTDRSAGDLMKEGAHDAIGAEMKVQTQNAAAPENVIDSAKVTRYANLIKAVCKQARTVSTTAVVSLPVSAVFHTIVNLPIVKKEEVDALLKAEIRKLLPYKLEETALDYELLPRPADAKVQTVLVNAVPKSMVLFFSKVFQEAGLKLHALEPESVALARSLIGRDTSLTMIIDIGAERTNFFIIDQTVPITHHSIELGGNKISKGLASMLGVDEKLIERLKEDLFNQLLRHPDTAGISKEKFLAIFTAIIDPIMKEIAYSFNLYLRQAWNETKRPEKIILTGGGGLFPFLAEFISDTFKIKCYVGDPWGRVLYQEALKPVLHDIGPRMAVAIGLALKNLV
jgi:type IV pilus assembly protein PilM